jgi:hypothetical protein
VIQEWADYTANDGLTGAELVMAFEDEKQKVLSSCVLWFAETDRAIRCGELAWGDMSEAEVHLYRMVRAWRVKVEGGRSAVRKIVDGKR